MEDHAADATGHNHDHDDLAHEVMNEGGVAGQPSPYDLYYEYVESVNPNLICCICGEAFMSPVVSATTCGHTFCLHCITRALEVKQACPIDRQPLTVEDLRPAVQIIVNMVNELRTKCPNHKKGCEAVMERGLVQQHVRDMCPFELVSCLNAPSGCQGVMPRRVMLEEHLKVCEFRKSTCDLCGDSVQESLLNVCKNGFSCGFYPD